MQATTSVVVVDSKPFIYQPGQLYIEYVSSYLIGCDAHNIISKGMIGTIYIYTFT